MLQIKRLLIILLILFCCCSKSGSDVKMYKTNVFDRLSIYIDPNKRYQGQEIGEIPFKAKVEIVDNNEVKDGDWSFIKIKYKDIVGYVFSTYLSERSDIPFVDKVKYDYALNEFEHDGKSVVDFVKKNMVEYGKCEEPVSNEYYIDDPQIYTFYGKDCDRRDAKYIMVIMISKLHKEFNYHIVFTINSKNKYSCEASGMTSFTNEDGTENVEYYIETIRSGNAGYCP